eukprot:922787-Alexandrium_andersonii.AAC.1
MAFEADRRCGDDVAVMRMVKTVGFHDDGTGGDADAGGAQDGADDGDEVAPDRGGGDDDDDDDNDGDAD